MKKIFNIFKKKPIHIYKGYVGYASPKETEICLYGNLGNVFTFPKIKDVTAGDDIEIIIKVTKHFKDK